MKGYSEKELFTKDAKSCLEMAQKIIDSIDNEWNTKDELRCHEVARVCYELIYKKYSNIVVVDGVYGSVNHSWLVVERKFILDVYAIGRLPQVQLVHPWVPGIHDDEYSEREERNDIDDDLVEKMVKDISKKHKKVKAKKPSTSSLKKAKKMLFDLENNINIGKMNLCGSCKYFNPRLNKTKAELVNFGHIGRCDSPYRNAKLSGPELDVDIWKCGFREEEMQVLITQLENKA